MNLGYVRNRKRSSDSSVVSKVWKQATSVLLVILACVVRSPIEQGFVCMTNRRWQNWWNVTAEIQLQETLWLPSGFLFFILLDPLLWGNHVVGSSLEMLMWRGTKESCQQPHKWALSASLSPKQVFQDCNTSQHFDWNFI